MTSQRQWHLNEKLMVAIIAGLVINMISSGANIWYTFKMLDTDPPIIERIIKIEYALSEQGRVNQAILDELKDAKRERAKFIGEQQRRTPMVNYIERLMQQGGLNGQVPYKH